MNTKENKLIQGCIQQEQKLLHEIVPSLASQLLKKEPFALRITDNRLRDLSETAECRGYSQFDSLCPSSNVESLGLLNFIRLAAIFYKRFADSLERGR